MKKLISLFNKKVLTKKYTSILEMNLIFFFFWEKKKKIEWRLDPCLVTIIKNNFKK